MTSLALCLAGPQYRWDFARGGLVETRAWLASRTVVSGPALADGVGAGQGDGDGGGARAAAVAMVRGAAERMLAAARVHPGCDALELRWTVPAARPAAGSGFGFNSGPAASAGPAPGCASLAMTARSDTSERVARAAVDAVAALLPPGYATAPAPPPGPSRAADSFLDLRRAELRLRPSRPGADGPGVIWALTDSGGDASGWNDALTALLALSGVTVSVLVVPARLHPAETRLLDAYLDDLERIAVEHDDVDIMRRLVRRPGDAAARRAATAWREQRPGLDDPVLLRIGLRGAPAALASAATSLAAGIAANDDGTGGLMRPVPAAGADEAAWAAHSFDNLTIVPWGPSADRFASPALGAGGYPGADPSGALVRLLFLHGSDDAAHRLLLPVPTPTGCPGLPTSRRTEAYRPSLLAPRDADILLGRQLGTDAPVGIRPDELTGHLVVTGAPGRGKTTAVQSLLVRLWREHRIPFLVVEPFRSEYRGLRQRLGEDVTVLTAGREDLRPLRLNLFDRLPGERPEQHRSGLLDAFAMGTALVSPLDELLRHSLDRAYETPPVSVRTLLAAFDEVFETYRYGGEARNLASAMCLRLRRLMGADDVARTVSARTDTLLPVLDRPVVVELHELHSPDDVRFVSALIMQRVRAVARARGAQGGLRHLTVLEEAHVLLDAADRDSGSLETGQRLRRLAVEALANDLLTLRGLGEGIALVTQQPSALVAQARAAASNRLVLGLTHAQDRGAMSEDLDLDASLSRLIAGLGPGEALLRTARREETVPLRLEPAPGIDTSRPVPDAELLRA